MDNSTIMTANLHEVWVFGPGDYREAVGECGLCPADRAGAMAEALRRWLRLGVWVHGDLPDDLLQYPSWLRSCGVDPLACRVRSRVVRAENLNAVRDCPDREAAGV